MWDQDAARDLNGQSRSPAELSGQPRDRAVIEEACGSRPDLAFCKMHVHILTST